MSKIAPINYVCGNKYLKHLKYLPAYYNKLSYYYLWQSNVKHLACIIGEHIPVFESQMFRIYTGGSMQSSVMYMCHVVLYFVSRDYLSFEYNSYYKF